MTDTRLSGRDLAAAMENLKEPGSYQPRYFITHGMKVSDREAVEYFKNSDVVVVDRNGDEWVGGKLRKRD